MKNKGNNATQFWRRNAGRHNSEVGVDECALMGRTSEGRTVSALAEAPQHCTDPVLHWLTRIIGVGGRG